MPGHKKNPLSLGAAQPSRRTTALLGAALLTVTLAFVAAAYAKTALPVYASPALKAEWNALSIDPYFIGLLLQAIIVPAALIYLFSATPLFRRVVGREISPRDRLKLFAALLGIQFLTQGYQLWLAKAMGEPLIWFTPLVIIVIGALLGGCQVGVGLSVVNILFSGSYELWQGWGNEFGELLQMGGVSALLGNPPWGLILRENYLLKMQVASVLWAGLAISFIADLFSRQNPISLPAAVLLGAAAEGLSAVLTHLAGAPPGLARLLPGALISGLVMLVFALLTRNAQAQDARRRVKEAELARARAELRALRAQINPHFLFNALNTIRYFVRVDPQSARRLLLDLSELFQRALRSGEFVPLEDEISYAKAYLGLEKARLDERLQIEWFIHTNTPLTHPVPTLVLQPIVENAVIHGIAPQSEGGRVRVSIAREGETLLLRVEDNGAGIPAEKLAALLSPAQTTHSIGLKNVDARLRALYGSAYRLRIQSEAGQGARVEIRIPLPE